MKIMLFYNISKPHPILDILFYFDACNKQNGFLKGKFKQDFFKLTLNIGVEEDENSKSVSLGGTLKVVGEQKHGISTRHLQGYPD